MYEYYFPDDFCVFEINNLNQENCRESKVSIRTVLPKNQNSKNVPKPLKEFTDTPTSSEPYTKNTVERKDKQGAKKTMSTNSSCIKFTLEEIILSVCNSARYIFVD